MYKQPKDLVPPLKSPCLSVSFLPQPLQDSLHPFILRISAYLNLPCCVETVAVKHAVSQAATVEESFTDILQNRLSVCSINKLLSQKNS